MCRAVLRCALLCVTLIFTLSFTAAAAEVNLKADPEFTAYGSSADNERLAEILGMTEASLESYCTENEIVYLAVNDDNTKQIRLTESKTPFSEAVGELSALSESEAEAVTADLAGKDFQAELVLANGKRFVKATAALSDSGGNYILTRYITVTDKKEYALSFYTAASESNDYAERIFKTLSFGKAESGAPVSLKGVMLFAAAALILVLMGYILYTVIRDIRLKRGLGKGENECNPS